MTTLNTASWRLVEETDFLSATGWLQDEVAEEFQMFHEFITPIVTHRSPVSVGALYRSWKEFRGSDVEYPLSVNDIKRLWTAMAILYQTDPTYGYIPAECILYDSSTRTLLEELQLTHAVH